MNSDKIKVIIFFPELTNYQSNLYRHISNDSIDVEYYYCKKIKFWESTENIHKSYKESKINYFSIPIKSNPNEKYEEVFSMKLFFKLIKEKPQILVVNSNFLFSLPYLLIAKCCKIKVISQTTDIPNTKTIFGKLSNFILKCNDYFVRHYIVPSEKKKTLMEQNNINSEKISVIGHGVNTKTFSPKKTWPSIVPKDKKIIFSNGRLTKVKGQQLLIKSFVKIKKQVENSFLIIIGDGPEKENIKKIIKIEELEKDILLLDGMENSKMPEFYSVADLIVVPTIVSEPFGTIYLESMASEKPTVSFDIDGGKKDFIKDGVNGVFVQPKNINKLTDSIIDLLKDDQKRLEMGINARKLICEKYSYKTISQKWIEIIKK